MSTILFVSIFIVAMFIVFAILAERDRRRDD